MKSVKDVIRYLEDHDVLYYETGSVQFGCSSEESDYDIVILDLESNIEEGLKRYLCNIDILYENVSERYPGIKFHAGTTEINIIPVNSYKDFYNWILATNAVKDIYKSGVNLNKIERADFFEKMIKRSVIYSSVIQINKETVTNLINLHRKVIW